MNLKAKSSQVRTGFIVNVIANGGAHIFSTANNYLKKCQTHLTHIFKSRKAAIFPSFKKACKYFQRSLASLLNN
jgi:hypothetical protein